MLKENKKEQEGIIIGEVQLILAEKRTSLSTMRTGIAVLALPLSVFSVLVATSKYYDIISVIHFMIPLVIICAVLATLGVYLIVRSIIKIHRYDKIILKIKRTNSQLAEFIE